MQKVDKIKKRFKNLKRFKVELQGFEPWSKHIRHKLSTCLSSYYLSGYSRNLANQLYP